MAHNKKGKQPLEGEGFSGTTRDGVLGTEVMNSTEVLVQNFRYL
jgi:hypothetical protein